MLSEKLKDRFKVSNTAHDRILVAEACSLEAKLQVAEAELARMKEDLTNMTYSNDQHRKMAESWRGRAVRADELEAEVARMKEYEERRKKRMVMIDHCDYMTEGDIDKEIVAATRTATEAALRYAWNGQADYINRLELDEWVTRGLAALLGEK